MELAPAGVPLSFEVTFDRDDLLVGMSVYDDSGILPVLASGPDLMMLVVGSTYRGKFTADPGKNYIIVKAVYTDMSLTVMDPNYSQGSESIVAQFLNNVNPCQVVGIVENPGDVIGVVEC